MALTDILPSGAAGSIRGAAASNYNPVNMVANARKFADAKANNWLVKPAAAQGIAGFIFDYEGETSLSADSDITDHYTEQNRFFQDHVAIKPIEITMRGFAGEVVQEAPNGILGLLDGLQNKLTILEGLLGKYTPQATQKIHAALSKATATVNKLDTAIGRAQNIVGLIAGSAAPSKIELAFSNLMALRDTSQVFTLVSPWGLLSFQDPATGKATPRSFVIRRLVFVADEYTKTWSDISVTMKEIRFASVMGGSRGLTAAISNGNNAGRAAAQRQGPTNKGKTAGLDISFPTLKQAFPVPLA